MNEELKLFRKKLEDILNEYPNKRFLEEIPSEEIVKMRNEVGCGIWFCTQVLRKTSNINEAITLGNYILANRLYNF
jgi:predicted peroxiredoxin